MAWNQPKRKSRALPQIDERDPFGNQPTGISAKAYAVAALVAVALAAGAVVVWA